MEPNAKVKVCYACDHEADQHLSGIGKCTVPGCTSKCFCVLDIAAPQVCVCGHTWGSHSDTSCNCCDGSGRFQTAEAKAVNDAAIVSLPNCDAVPAPTTQAAAPTVKCPNRLRFIKNAKTTDGRWDSTFMVIYVPPGVTLNYSGSRVVVWTNLNVEQYLTDGSDYKEISFREATERMLQASMGKL